MAGSIYRGSSFATERTGSNRRWLRRESACRIGRCGEKRELLHEGVLASLRIGQFGTHFLGEAIVDLTQFFQSRKMNLDKLSRPFPHVIIRPKTKNVRPDRAHGETVRGQP